jgi:hypothetical protein
MTLMKRRSLVFVGLMLSVALAQAGFVAQPYGDQTVAADGSVTLQQGGVIRDNKRGYSIDAKFIQYKDNEFLKATDAKIKNNTGQTINAKSVDYTIKNDRMNIAGPLAYGDNNVKGLVAQKSVAYPDRKQIVALGGVKAQSPSFKADAVAFDANRNLAFLYGNFEYTSSEGKTNRGNSSESALLVDYTNKDKPLIKLGKAISADVQANFVKLIQQSR